MYIDDVLIMSESFHEHLQLVNKVMKTLSSCGVTLNLNKCKWFHQEVEFLGHVVSQKGLAKPDSYVKEVANFPRPETKRQLKQFLGLINFQRKFVKDCSNCLLYTSPSPRDKRQSRMPSSA